LFDVTQESWYYGYLNTNQVLINSLVSKRSFRELRMIGIEGDLEFGLRTRSEWYFLQKDLERGVLAGSVRARPQFMRIPLGSLAEELEWSQRKAGRKIIIASVPARIGEHRQVMQEVEAMCSQFDDVHLSFSRQGDLIDTAFSSSPMPSSAGGVVGTGCPPAPCGSVASSPVKVFTPFIVVSSPKSGPSETQKGVYNFPTMEKIKILADERRLIIGYDWEGLSNCSDEDKALFELLKKEGLSAEDKHKIVYQTQWYKLYTGQVKGCTRTVAHELGKATMICINGGLITEAEQRQIERTKKAIEKDLESMTLSTSKPKIDIVRFNTFQEMEKWLDEQ